MNNETKQKQTNVKFTVDELKDLIDEARTEGMQNVANFWAEELKALVATHKLGTGVKTAQQLKELA